MNLTTTISENTEYKIAINPTDILTLIINLQLKHNNIREFSSTDIINGTKEYFGIELSRHKLPQLMAAKYGPVNLGFLSDRKNNSLRHFYELNQPEKVVKTLLNNIENGLFDKYMSALTANARPDRNSEPKDNEATIVNTGNKIAPTDLIPVLIALKKRAPFQEEFTAAEIIKIIKSEHGITVTPKKLWQLMTAKFGPVKLGIITDRHNSFRHFYKLNDPLTIVHQLLNNINPNLPKKYFNIFQGVKTAEHTTTSINKTIKILHHDNEHLTADNYLTFNIFNNLKKEESITNLSLKNKD